MKDVFLFLLAKEWGDAYDCVNKKRENDGKRSRKNG